MYIFIFEDGTIVKGDIFTDTDKESIGAGFLDVIDIGENNPKYWLDGEWNELETIEEHIKN